jgi:hypothetical protein
MARHALHFVERHTAVGAGIDTEVTAAAALFVDEYQPVLVFGYGPARTHCPAEGIIAVEAEHGEKIHMEIALDLPRADSYYPAPAGCCLKGQVVLLSAGYFTGMTTDTTVDVD